MIQIQTLYTSIQRNDCSEEFSIHVYTVDTDTFTADRLKPVDSKEEELIGHCFTLKWSQTATLLNTHIYTDTHKMPT